MKHFVSKLLIWGQNGPTNALVVRQVSPRLIAIILNKISCFSSHHGPIKPRILDFRIIKRPEQLKHRLYFC